MRYEKGSFIVVPNKEALRGLDIKAQAVFMWLCHYANQDGKCYPSHVRLMKDTGFNTKVPLLRALKILKEAGLIDIDSGKSRGTVNYYYINLYRPSNQEIAKEYEKLRDKGSERLKRCIQNNTGGVYKTTQGVYTKQHTELNPKTQSKNSTTAQSAEKALLNDIIDLFKGVNPSYGRLFGRKNQRDAIRRLVGLHGVEKVMKVIKALEKTNVVPYFPIITTPIQLEENWGKWESALEREKNTQEKKKKGKGRGLA